MDANSYSGSLLGTATIAIFLGISWFCKNKCRHSKCKLNSKCLEISSEEDTRNTLREEIILELQNEGVIPLQRQRAFTEIQSSLV